MEAPINDMLIKYMVTSIKLRIEKIIQKRIETLIKNGNSTPYLLDIKEKYIICESDIKEKLMKKINSKKLNEKWYKLEKDDLVHYTQTMKICIDGTYMLQDSDGILYDMNPENNIIGKINGDNKIIWFDKFL